MTPPSLQLLGQVCIANVQEKWAVQTHDFIFFLKNTHFWHSYCSVAFALEKLSYLHTPWLSICLSRTMFVWGCVCVSEKMRKAIFASNGQCWKLLRFAQVGSAREARLGHCQAVLRDTSVQVSVGQSQRGGLASRLRLVLSSIGMNVSLNVF